MRASDRIDMVEPMLKQSTNDPGGESNYDGHIRVWQDGFELFNMEQIATRYPDSWNEFSFNAYSKTNGITVNGAASNLVTYADEIVIHDQYIN